MATRTALQMADDIRRVEYAIGESNNDEMTDNTFTDSQELADFWVLVEALDKQVGKVASRYVSVTGKAWVDLKTDRD